LLNVIVKLKISYAKHVACIVGHAVMSIIKKKSLHSATYCAFDTYILPCNENTDTASYASVDG